MNTSLDNHINKYISGFETTSLDEMNSVKLMKRTDTKFVFNANKLESILNDAVSEYRILQVEESRLIPYATVYYDTEDFKLYQMHHNGKLNRKKIRHRTYVQTGLSFLEFKDKNNKGVTDKKRVKYNSVELNSEEGNTALVKHSSFSSEDLNHALWTYFNRFTLVHRQLQERITIDVNLSFKDVASKNEAGYPKLCIAEVKRDQNGQRSPFISTLKEHRILPMGFSKYCMGMALLNNSVKANLFKPRIKRLEKLMND